MRVRFSLPAPSLQINDLCRCKDAFGDFPNIFSLELLGCLTLSIKKLRYAVDCNFPTVVAALRRMRQIV